MRWRVAALCASALLVAVAWLLPINEYRAMGVEALDCDGPSNVALAAVPATLLALPVLMMVDRRRATKAEAVAALLAVVLAVVAAGRLHEAREARTAQAAACAATVGTAG